MTFPKTIEQFLIGVLFCLVCISCAKQPVETVETVETVTRTTSAESPSPAESPMRNHRETPALAEVLTVPDVSGEELEKFFTPASKWMERASENVRQKVEKRDFVWKHNGKELQLGVIDDETSNFVTWETSPKFWQMNPNIHQFPIILTEAPQRFGPAPTN
jgi:hypothetical protein